MAIPLKEWNGFHLYFYKDMKDNDEHLFHHTLIYHLYRFWESAYFYPWPAELFVPLLLNPKGVFTYSGFMVLLGYTIVT